MPSMKDGLHSDTIYQISAVSRHDAFHRDGRYKKNQPGSSVGCLVKIIPGKAYYDTRNVIPKHKANGYWSGTFEIVNGINSYGYESHILGSGLYFIGIQLREVGKVGVV